MNKFIALNVAKWYHWTEIPRGSWYLMLGETFFVYGISLGSWWMFSYHLASCIFLWFSASYVQRVHHNYYTSKGYVQMGMTSNSVWTPRGVGPSFPRYSDLDL